MSTADAIQLTWKLVLVVVLICVNAGFSMAEYALITVRKTRIRQLVEEGNRSAVMVEHMLGSPTRMMATIQTAVTLIATFSSALAATSAVTPLARWIRLVLPPSLGNAAAPIALALVTVPVAVLTLVVGEVAPKSIAVRNAERISLVAVHPVRWLENLLGPIVACLTMLSHIIVRPFGGKPSFTVPAVNEEELKLLVEASEEQGVLQADETEMIHSILDFGDTVVRKVMTPRIDITAIEAKTSIKEIVFRIAESGHSRIPIYEGDLDSVIGIVHAKDILTRSASLSLENLALQDVLRPPYFIPETKKIDELLAEFRRNNQQIAMVRDEYGVTCGLITIEDLLEEIVGEIHDEYDVEETMVQVLDKHTSLLNGKMPISEVNDKLGLEIPEQESDTIGGFVFGLLGHQGDVGESGEWNGVRFRVEATDGRRITRLRLTQPSGAGRPKPDADPPAEDKSSTP